MAKATTIAGYKAAWRLELKEFYRIANDTCQDDELFKEYTDWLVVGDKLIDRAANHLVEIGVYNPEETTDVE